MTVVVAVSVVLAVSWLTFEAYSVPAIMKEGRLSPDDPTSYARIGELYICTALLTGSLL